MSRIGKKPVAVPDGVSVAIVDREVSVKGPKGELKFNFCPQVSVKYVAEDKALIVEQTEDTRVSNAMHGLTRALVQNMVVGVTQGYEKKLEIFGTGYLAAVQGNVLQVRVGFANEVHKEIPAGLTVKCPDQLHVHISGCDKQLVGQFAAEVRGKRPPEPYKGKGIKYVDEVVRRKEGKTGGKK